MENIKLIYSGFHGKDFFNLRIHKPEKFVDIDYPSNLFFIQLSPFQIKKINRKVGCQSHRMIFGNYHKILGACDCGEGLNLNEPIRARKIGYNNYIILGNYPQN